ncbi:uncharacterized protein TNIN_369281 [Trichonephila inaurata madagascariensis]|uniref:Uncharacterized protein n=1 Tax=Trichonephila inaurata madagascariensis TaxID=2747483 RepID=A0A8X6YTH5_9ARAC|nr:uncharacterized protein TNIN_369281 [Trichonephila inaurata madagascariensis]
MNNFLFMRRETRSSRPRKHPFRNKRSKVQRLRRAREREIKFKALLEQNAASVQAWLQKVSQGNSAIQDMLLTKTKEVLDPTEPNVNDLNYLSNFFMFDEPVEENMDDSVWKRMNSEYFENEGANYDSKSGNDSVTRSATHFLHNSSTNDLSYMNIQMNDKSTLRTDLQVHLSNIKKEADEDATFSNEDCYILHEKIPTIKVESDSKLSCHNEDKILSANLLHTINQENPSPLNKNHEISDLSNMSCTINSCTEYHSERNENRDDKCQFIKLEFQEVNCDKYTETFQEEIDLETMYHKTRADIMEDPTSYTVAALNDSTKWKGRVLDYSRTNREIMKEKRNARRLIIRNFLYHPQNPLLSMDICEKRELSAETSENLMAKDNDFKNMICTKKTCKKVHSSDLSHFQTTLDLDDEIFKTKHIFDPDFGRIRISDMR